MDNNREARVEQIQEYQLTYDEAMEPLLEDIRTIDAALTRTPKLLDAAMKSKFEDVKFNLKLLEDDGSRPFGCRHAVQAGGCKSQPGAPGEGWIPRLSQFRFLFGDFVAGIPRSQKN